MSHPNPVDIFYSGFYAGQIKNGLQRNVRGRFRGNSWNRTNDTSIFSAVLYQLSYVAVFPVGSSLLWGPQRYEFKTMTQG